MVVKATGKSGQERAHERRRNLIILALLLAILAIALIVNRLLPSHPANPNHLRTALNRAADDHTQLASLFAHSTPHGVMIPLDDSTGLGGPEDPGLWIEEHPSDPASLPGTSDQLSGGETPSFDLVSADGGMASPFAPGGAPSGPFAGKGFGGQDGGGGVSGTGKALPDTTDENDPNTPKILPTALPQVQASPVPEPQSWLMMIGGLLITGSALRRRAQNAFLQRNATSDPVALAR